MEIPFVGPLTLSGFSSAWFFLYLIAIVGAVAIYLLLRKARRKRDAPPAPLPPATEPDST